MNPFLFVVPVSLLMIAVELFVAHRRGVQVYRLKDSITSLNIGAISQFVITLGAFISVSMYTLILDKFGAFVWDTSNPLTWVLALVLYDFFYYWVHRTGHEVNFFWASHGIQFIDRHAPIGHGLLFQMGFLYSPGAARFSAEGLFGGRIY